MSVSSEVRRTLVKSPPELWAELGDPDSLARHLGELGEIRVTRVDPEKAVEWEADDATGAVRLEPSGWGTKVTLTVVREIALPESPAATEPVTEPTTEPVTEPIIAEPPIAVAEDPAEPEQHLEGRRGFFARLFRRRRMDRRMDHVVELESTEIVEPAPELEPEAEPQLEEPPEDLSAELRAAEEVAAEHVTALLTTVLDRLGAAHHRPFSRS
jgi:hypothetical protein